MSHSPYILINQLSFSLPSGKTLFNALSFTFPNKKIGLIGRNGIGKSTLLKLIKGDLSPNSGSIRTEARLAYVPQHYFLSPKITVAQLLDCEEKIQAFD